MEKNLEETKYLQSVVLFNEGPKVALVNYIEEGDKNKEPNLQFQEISGYILITEVRGSKMKTTTKYISYNGKVDDGILVDSVVKYITPTDRLEEDLIIPTYDPTIGMGGYWDYESYRSLGRNDSRSSYAMYKDLEDFFGIKLELPKKFKEARVIYVSFYHYGIEVEDYDNSVNIKVSVPGIAGFWKNFSIKKSGMTEKELISEFAMNVSGELFPWYKVCGVLCQFQVRFPENYEPFWEIYKYALGKDVTGDTKIVEKFIEAINNNLVRYK